MTKLDKKIIKKIFFTGFSIDKIGLDIYYKILNNPKSHKIKDIADTFQGEINMTNHKRFFSEKNSKFNGTLLKGANIQTYFVTKKLLKEKKNFWI